MNNSVCFESSGYSGINAYYDSLSVITEVIVGKKQQLLSSVLSCLQQF